MKAIKAFGVLVALGAMLTALNLGGVAGCGDDGGGGGTGGANDNVTTARLTATFQSLSGFAEDDTAALIVRSEQAGLKSQTGECVVTDTEVTCPCEGGGSFTFSFVSDTESDLVFGNCIDAEGNLIDGTMTIVSDGTGSSATIEFNDLTTDFGDCGSFTLNGTETIEGNNIVIDVTATGGGETINVDGDLTANDDETISGSLSYSGSVEADCFFDHTDVSICPNTADACGLPVDEVCDGDAYADFCE